MLSFSSPSFYYPLTWYPVFWWLSLAVSCFLAILTSTSPSIHDYFFKQFCFPIYYLCLILSLVILHFMTHCSSSLIKSPIWNVTLDMFIWAIFFTYFTNYHQLFFVPYYLLDDSCDPDFHIFLLPVPCISVLVFFQITCHSYPGTSETVLLRYSSPWFFLPDLNLSMVLSTTFHIGLLCSVRFPSSFCDNLLIFRFYVI